MNIFYNQKNTLGQLYIVPTPIGNLADISQRAISVLKQVDLIASENTRHTNALLQHFLIKTSLFNLNNFNEKKNILILIEKLKKGNYIALVSDAGTPLINDPGYHLVKFCHQIGIKVIPLPGPCAAITALSASGLPTDRFCYEGFLPKKTEKRRNRLNLLKIEPRTLIFYESIHRLIKSLEDMVFIFGESRYIVLARELTKIWEDIYRAPIGELLQWIKKHPNKHKGEIVLIVEGHQKSKHNLSYEVLRTFAILKTKLSFKAAISITSEIYKVRKSELYEYNLQESKNSNLIKR